MNQGTGCVLDNYRMSSGTALPWSYPQQAATMQVVLWLRSTPTGKQLLLDTDLSRNAHHVFSGRMHPQFAAPSQHYAEKETPLKRTP